MDTQPDTDPPNKNEGAGSGVGWLLAVAVFGALAIVSAPWALNQAWMAFVFKPLATICVIGYAWSRGRKTAVQRRWVLIALFFSLASDVALLWPKEGFLIGLVFFLFAHLSYLVAFTREQRLAARWLPFVAYALLAGSIFWHFWVSVPYSQRGPMGGYVVCLAAMAAQTAVLWMCGSPRSGGLAIAGLLFVVSESLWAANRFSMPIQAASLWIFSSYWLAQVLIARWLAPPQTANAGSA